MSESEITVLIRHFEALFAAHTQDETRRYGQIIDEVKKSQTASDRRHKETGAKIEALTEELKCVQPCPELIASVPNGDFQGHHDYHDRRILDAKERKELHQYIRKVVFTSAVMAVGSWLTLLVWQALLNGPKL